MSQEINEQSITVKTEKVSTDAPTAVTAPSPIASFADAFYGKLKEQSFTILLLVAIMYYQNSIFTRQMEEYKKMIGEKETLILKLTNDERERLIERERYLVTQRDQFINEMKAVSEYSMRKQEAQQ